MKARQGFDDYLDIKAPRSRPAAAENLLLPLVTE
jgi:hypothetical protein